MGLSGQMRPGKTDMGGYWSKRQSYRMAGTDVTKTRVKVQVDPVEFLGGYQGARKRGYGV